jgi:hypothetical protein
MGKRAFRWRKRKKNDDEAGASLPMPKNPHNPVSSRVPVFAEEPPKPERELFFGEENRMARTTT